MQLSIIIVSYNTSKLLGECIGSVFKNTKRIRFEIIVVDNNSVDDSVGMLKKKYPNIRLIENKSNVGFGGANNQGLGAAKGKYILFLNSDTLVKGEALNEMINFMDDDKKIGVLGPKLLLKDGSIQPWAISYNPNILRSLAEKPLGFLGKYFSNNKFFKIIAYLFTLRFWEHDETKEVDWVTGAALLMRKSILDRIGGFDTNFFLYFEDVDLCYRTKEAGYKVFFFPGSEIVHYGGSSVTSSSRQKEYYYQSQKYFYKKHYSLLSRVALILIRFPYILIYNLYRKNKERKQNEKK